MEPVVANKSEQFPTNPEALINEKLAAKFLGVTTRAMQKWRQTGEGPLHVRISSRCVRYRLQEISKWAEGKLKTSTSME